MYFFHEANLRPNELGRNVRKVYEDFSHDWGVAYVPVANEKYLINQDGYGDFLRKQGFNLNFSDIAIKLFSDSLYLHLEKVNHVLRETFQLFIERMHGYTADINQGFAHYIVFDAFLQNMADLIADFRNLFHM